MEFLYGMESAMFIGDGGFGMKLAFNWKEYRGPLIASGLIILLTIGWAAHSIFVLGERTRDPLRRYALDVANFTDDLITVNSAGEVDISMVQKYFQRQIGRTDYLRSVALLSNGKALCSAGEQSPSFPVLGSYGEEERSGIVYLWKRIGESMTLPQRVAPAGGPPPGVPRPEGPRPEGPRPQVGPGEPFKWKAVNAVESLARDDLVLIIGLSARHGIGAAIPFRDSLIFRFVVMILFSMGLVLAWAQSIKSRELKNQLEVERARSEHFESLGLTAAGLAHETKNPLGIILGLAQRISKSDDCPEEILHMAEHIQDASDEAAARLGEFLNYSSLKAPDQTFQSGAVLLSRATDALLPHFEAKGVNLTFEAEEIMVYCDGAMIIQILVNLLMNSLHASKKDDSVSVTLSSEKGLGRLKVTDNGTGIEKDLQKDVFKPYVTGRSEGHGLGLAICKRIADLHGWSIDLRSDSVVGTQITLGNLKVKRREG
jgi:signal transduction histidine kinase